MEVGDLVRLGANGVVQFRVVELDATHAKIEPVVETPGGYPFSMRLVDLHPWSE